MHGYATVAGLAFEGDSALLLLLVHRIPTHLRQRRKGTALLRSLSPVGLYPVAKMPVSRSERITQEPLFSDSHHPTHGRDPDCFGPHGSAEDLAAPLGSSGQVPGDLSPPISARSASIEMPGEVRLPRLPSCQVVRANFR